MEKFFATCPRGLERVLAAELVQLGANSIQAVDGGVGFTGELATCYAINLESRVASRVLWQVGEAGYRSEHDVYEAALRIEWPRWFSPRHTIRVNVSAIKSPVKSLDYITLRVKDAVCDVFHMAASRRPDINTRSPDVRIHAFLTRDTATFYLDTSGEALFKRGWRSVAGAAPLRENLAAGILKLAGWTAPAPLLDPMCGSGTFLIEAAMMALDTAPGLGRAFGFEKLANFDSKTWTLLFERVRSRRRMSQPLPIYGSDKLGSALKLASDNLALAGLEVAVHLKQKDILDGGPPAPGGIIVMNPPYGERLAAKDELAAFYPKLGDVLKQRYAGWTAYILTADLRLAKLIGLAASKRTPLYNGALDCRLFEFKLVAGSMRRTKRDA